MREAMGGDPTSDETIFETHRYLLTSREVLAATAASLDITGKVHPRGSPVEWLRKRVSIDRVANTRILRIHALAPTAELARSIAEGIADVYDTEDSKRRRADSEKRVRFLQEQITDVKANVEKSEMALIQYVETANLDLVDMPNADSDAKGSDLAPAGSSTLKTLEDKRALKEQELDQGRLDKTDAHPSIVRIREELKMLGARIAEEKRRVADENKKRIRYGMLRRDAEINRQLLAVLMKETKDASLVGDDREPRILKREAAIAAAKPVTPRPKRDLPLGTLAGLLAGVALAFLQETLDRTMKSREEVERATGLAVLAAVHRADGARRTGEKPGRFLLRAEGAWGPEVEDFRTLRTNLRYARPDGENRSVLVTSSVPEEGKTTVATNLAAVMAASGERVLLVDADLRRPAVHLAMGIENGPGLTNALVERGTDPMSVVRATAWANLSVITAGAFAPNPPDILESARMRELLAIWSKKFDRVVIDSPPQGSVVDPAILAPIVDGVLLVVGAGRVEAERARLAKRSLAAVGAKFYGAVVNRLADDPARYGYGYTGYGYGTEAGGSGDAGDAAA